MRLRTALVPLALAAMLLVAGCSGTTNVVPNANAATAAEQPNVEPAAAQVGGDGRTITVGASGSVEAEPDRAVVEVAVTATGDDVATVRSQLAENASAMRTALQETGIDEGSISTEYYDISRDRHREPGRDEPKYRARHSFTVTVENPDRVGEVIVVAVENGASEVDRVRFTLTKETRRELREDALADAMSNARSQADTIAGNSALRIDGVDTVSTAEVNVRPFRQETVAFAAAGDGGGTSISSGPVTVTAQVQVVYDAEREN
jgi:hypothetical protein